jgi:lysophospholipase L1-like esterase
MLSTFRPLIAGVVLAVLLVPTGLSGQINFQKTGYYLSLGDSVPAGQGALPATHGFVYQLYDHGAFGAAQHTDFSNIAIKGATAGEVQLLQVPQALCIQPPRIALAPSVITLSAGANDFLVYIATNGIPPDPFTTIPAVADGIAANVANIVRSLVFGVPILPAPCVAGIPGVTILVSNYYSFDHPDPVLDAILDLALQSFSAGLEARLGQIRAEIQAAGKTARVALVDTFSAMEDRSGLLLIEKRDGFTGAFNFQIHPTNAGHTVIAREFERVWNSLQ